MTDYTQADILTLLALSESFEHFVEALNLPFDHPAVEQLCGEGHVVTVPEADRSFVMAYAVWELMYHPDRTTVWMRRPQSKGRTPAFEAKVLADSLEQKLTARIGRSNSNYLEFDNGSRLIGRAVSDYAIKGMSFNRVIVEGVEEGSALWDRVMNSIRPQLTYGRLIILHKHVDAQ